ncbi:hypothetical protein FAVG1_07622 [Fusarium avenaceum]|nr:hypothetical protein FAVG1_07622 [Fusarium avenaceum]
MDGVVVTKGLVAERKRKATVASKVRVVAELQKIQVGELVAMLIQHAAILQSGSHLATVTETTTSWATETDTETVTTDGTTTVKTVSTRETTVFVTVSRGATDDEATMEETATDSDRKQKRFVPTAPRKHPGREAPATKTLQPVFLRPAASLNALADVFVQDQSTVTVGPTGTAASSSESGSGGGLSKGTIIGAAIGGGLGLILIVLLAFFLWRRRKSANEKQTQPSQVYAASHSEAPTTAQKPPPFMSTTPNITPFAAAGARDTWASSPSHDVRSDYSQPPAYPSPPPELADTQFAHEMHTSPQRSPQELYHPQYMSGLGLPEMRDQQRG